MGHEYDHAFQLLYRMAKSYANWEVATALRSPFLQNLHSDPRWTELQEMVGIAPNQLEDVDFNPNLRFETRP